MIKRITIELDEVETHTILEKLLAAEFPSLKGYRIHNVSILGEGSKKKRMKIVADGGKTEKGNQK